MKTVKITSETLVKVIKAVRKGEKVADLALKDGIKLGYLYCIISELRRKHGVTTGPREETMEDVFRNTALKLKENE